MSQTPLTDALWKLYDNDGTYTPSVEQKAHAFAVWKAAMKAYEESQLLWMDRTAKDRTGRVYASDPFHCERQMALLMRGETRPPVTGSGCFKMPRGNLTEAKIVCDLILSPAGKYVLSPNPEQERMETHLGGVPLSGYMDLVLDGLLFGPQYEGEEIPCDVKEKNPFGFKSCRTKGPDDKFSNVKQLSLYAKHKGAPFGVFLYIDAAWGDFFEARVNDVDAHYKQAMKTVGRADEKIQKGLLPEKPSWATTKTMPRARCEEIEDTRCSYCSLKEHCFEGFEATTVSGQIKWRKPLEGVGGRMPFGHNNRGGSITWETIEEEWYPCKMLGLFDCGPHKGEYQGKPTQMHAGLLVAEVDCEWPDGTPVIATTKVNLDVHKLANAKIFPWLKFVRPDDDEDTLQAWWRAADDADVYTAFESVDFYTSVTRQRSVPQSPEQSPIYRAWLDLPKKLPPVAKPIEFKSDYTAVPAEVTRSRGYCDGGWDAYMASRSASGAEAY